MTFYFKNIRNIPVGAGRVVVVVVGVVDGVGVVGHNTVMLLIIAVTESVLLSVK